MEMREKGENEGDKGERKKRMEGRVRRKWRCETRERMKERKEREKRMEGRVRRKWR